jgi:ribonuclease R
MGKKLKKDIFAEREAQKYEHPIPSREFILDYLIDRDRPASYRQICAELFLESSDDQEALRRRLLAMVRDGQLHQNRRGTYGLVSKMELISGRVVGHRDGYGFVIPDDGSEDLFVSARQMRVVFHGDKVLARVSGIDDRNRKEGVIVEVIERNTAEVVGRLVEESGITFVEPFNQRITQTILVPHDETSKSHKGQMVVVAITQQPSATARPLGKVIEVLGDHMAPGLEIDVAIRNHQLPHEWPKEVLREASLFDKSVSENEIKNRLDLRKLPFVTIDGEDAKDFDDAVYCEKRTNGSWGLYVAIADVSHYVKHNTDLDKESFNRGNSVYFPGRVIPMLPEVLSNELCSLNPNAPRLTLVCEMNISASGKITDYRFHEATIQSHARLTYNNVYAMIEKNDKSLQNQYQPLLPHLQELFILYHVLYKARHKRGSIDFDLPETKIIFGPGRKIERIEPLQRNDAHKLIEECMLCANISAAHYLLENECPTLFRVHEGPSTEKLNDLRKFLKELGLQLPGKSKPTPQDYSKLLQSIKGRPDEHLIQTVLLRSLSQAIYSPENKGHFGLAFDAYTHFTSPIRRYPDLLVHRGIRKILRKELKTGEKDPQYEKYGVQCSVTERRADDATREAVDWLKCEFMLNKVGEEFDGIISGVTSFGLFVELKQIFVEGLLHISLLKNDYYKFDPISHTLYGERTGERFRLGDPIKIKVVKVDLDERRIDFMLAEELEQRPAKKRKKKKKSL